MQRISSVSIDYKNVPQLVSLLFCGYVIVWYLQIGHRFPFLGDIRFEFVYAAVLTIIAIFIRGFSGVKNPLLKYTILFFLCFIVGLPFSYDIHLSWNIFINRVVKFAFMAVFIIAFVKSPNSLRYFIAAFMLACLKMGQEGLIGNITGGLMWENQGVMRLHGTTPMYTHSNSFAGMAMGTLPFIYYLFPITPRWIKFILITMLVFAANIILFSGSRTAYVAFFVFVLFSFLRSNKKMKFLVLAIIIGIIAIPQIPNDYVDRFRSVFTGQEKEGHSQGARIEILKDACKVFATHPLGVGVAAFPVVRKSMFGKEQDTHNLYLEVATNLGIQGLIIFILFIYKMMKVLNEISRESIKQIQEIEKEIKLSNNPKGLLGDVTKHVSDLKLINAIGSSVFMFIVIRLALGLFGMDLYEIYWWFALGLTVSLFNINKIAQDRTSAVLKLIGK